MRVRALRGGGACAAADLCHEADEAAHAELDIDHRGGWHWRHGVPFAALTSCQNISISISWYHVHGAPARSSRPRGGAE